MKRPILPLLTIIALCGGVFPQKSSAANYAWDGATQTWTNLASWNVGGSDPLTPPGASDSIISSISNGGNIQLSVDAGVTNWRQDSLDLTVVGNLGNHTLTVSGTVTVTGGSLNFRNSGANQLALNLNQIDVSNGTAQFGVNNNASPLQSFQAASMNLSGGITAFKLVNGGTATVSGTVSMANAAQLDVRWTNTAGENGTLAVGALASASSTAAVQTHHGAAATVGTLLLNTGASTNANFAGIVRNGGNASNVLNVVKQGTGTQAFSGANTYSGSTQVTAGTLLVNGTHTGAGAYAVNGSGILGGNGSLTTSSGAGVVIGSGGRLAAGQASGLAGTLTMSLASSSLDLSGAVGGANSGALIFDLGTTSDLISLSSGTLQIGSGSLEFSDFSFAAISGFGVGTYTLISTANTISGTLGSSLSGTVGGLSATISFGDSNTDLILTVVPEPSVGQLVGAASAGLCLLRWRRRANGAIQ